AREDGSDAIAPLSVFRVMAVEKNGVRAEFPGGSQRHGGMNSVFARFVTGGGNDASLVGTSADDNRFAAEVGAIKKLDGDEECVHVHVENIRDRRRGEIFGVCVKGSKSRQVRHEVSLRPESCADNLGALSRNDAGDTGEIVGDADIRPEWRFE